MRVLLIHPSALMYSEIFLRLEPLGLERVASAVQADGHDVRLMDMQVYRRSEVERQVTEFRPEAVGFSLNYLANVPEVVDMAKWIKTAVPGCLVFVGGHSVSFVAGQVLEHAGGAIDAVLQGEGEAGAPALLAEEGDEIARRLEQRRIQKEYYLETRCDVLLRNEEVFRRWKRLGLTYMFLGLEALDEEGLKAFRKRTTPVLNNKALEVARDIGLTVAINIIADPDWDEARFEFVRQWAMSVPEIVNITVQTPYPGTETWLTESRRLTTLDYRLFDVQHAVLPTRLPLYRFYTELVKTQSVLARKHLGVAALTKTAGIVARQMLRGRTNFVKMIWKFDQVYNADRQYSEHLREAKYLLPPPAEHPAEAVDRKDLFVHAPQRRRP